MSVAVEGTEGGGELQASGGGKYEDSDDEESSMMANLASMFPLLDHEVIATVLQTHDGQLEVVIDYLMAMSRDDGRESEAMQPEVQAYHEFQQEFQGQFIEDIGGLPELVPSFIYEPTLEEEEEEEDELDRLPTYDEACLPIEPGPPPYVPSAIQNYPCESLGLLPTLVTAIHEEERQLEAEGSDAMDQSVAVVGDQSASEGSGVREERERVELGSQQLIEQCTAIDLEDVFVVGRTGVLEPSGRRRRQHQTQTLEDDEEDLSYGDHSKHWTRLDSPTDDLQDQSPRSAGHRGKKLSKLAGKLGRRRTSKGDYKSQQERLETAKVKSPPLPFRRLMDDDEPADD